MTTYIRTLATLQARLHRAMLKASAGRELPEAFHPYFSQAFQSIGTAYAEMADTPEKNAWSYEMHEALNTAHELVEIAEDEAIKIERSRIAAMD